MGLSKAYDCLRYDLLIAKFETYDIDNDSLNLLLDQLTFKKQRTKIDFAYSKWSRIRSGTPQWSILGPLWFNIFVKDFIYYLYIRIL